MTKLYDTLSRLRAFKEGLPPYDGMSYKSRRRRPRNRKRRKTVLKAADKVSTEVLNHVLDRAVIAADALMASQAAKTLPEVYGSVPEGTPIRIADAIACMRERAKSGYDPAVALEYAKSSFPEVSLWDLWSTLRKMRGAPKFKLPTLLRGPAVHAKLLDSAMRAVLVSDNEWLEPSSLSSDGEVASIEWLDVSGRRLMFMLSREGYSCTYRDSFVARSVLTRLDDPSEFSTHWSRFLLAPVEHSDVLS